MISISEEWENGIRKSQRIDEGNIDEITLRNAIDGAITTLQTIQATTIDTVAKANTAIHQIAQIDEKLLKFIKRRI